MRVVDKDRVQIRVRIEGVYNDMPFVYEDPIDSDGSQYIWINAETQEEKCSGYWWREGNMACDCNRWQYLPDNIRDDVNGLECGHTVKINKIIPLESDCPTLLVDGYEDEW